MLKLVCCAFHRRRKRSEGKGDAIQVTRADRVKLSLLVNQLSSDELGQLVDMIQRDCPQALNEVSPSVCSLSCLSVCSCISSAVLTYLPCGCAGGRQGD